MKSMSNWCHCMAFTFGLIGSTFADSESFEELALNIDNIDDKTFYFDVFLGSRNIGFHNFHLKKVGGQIQVISNANMTFKAFLFKEIS